MMMGQLGVLHPQARCMVLTLHCTIRTLSFPPAPQADQVAKSSAAFDSSKPDPKSASEGVEKDVSGQWEGRRVPR